MTHTAQMDLESRLPTHADPRLNDHENHKTYFLTDEAVAMLTKTDFLDKVIFDNKYEDTKEFANALAHLCYQDIRFTRKVTKKLLKSVSYSNSDQVERLLVVIVALAGVKDEYQVPRLEYLFGYGYLMHVQSPEHEVLQYGLQVTRQKSFDDVYHILSGLDARNHDDALLNMLWRYKGRMDSFTLACLHSLCELLATDAVIAGFFSRLPAPNYCLARYTDWISPYLVEQLEEAAKYAGTGTAAKEEKITKV